MRLGIVAAPAVVMAALAACTTDGPGGGPGDGSRAPIKRVVAGTGDVPPADAAAAMADRGFARGDVGFVVRDLDSGAVVAAHNAGHTFIPASVAKLATAVAALEVLGADHRFRTRVLATGDRRGGRLRGDVILEGGGDPLLGVDDLLALCRQLRQAGIRRVDGRFLYDEELYRTRASIRPSQPADARYNPGVSALSLDFNRIRVDWRPAGAEEAGSEAAVAAHSVPALPAIRLEASSRPAGPGRTWTPEPGPAATTWRLSPDAPRRGTAELPVKRPGRVTAQVFRQVCARVGVALPAAAAGRAPAAGRVLAVHRSPPLASVVQAMLRYSNNLVAELLGLATSRALTGERQTLAESARTLRAWWRRRLPDVDWRGYALRNHAGLDARGRATPAQIAAILAFAARRGYADGAGNTRGLADLLPASGWENGLGGRLRGPATALGVWAKTGTMHYASGLAGYLFPGDGRRLAFAVFVNDLARRRAYDAAAQPRAPRRQRRITAWRERAKALEGDLVSLWASARLGSVRMGALRNRLTEP